METQLHKQEVAVFGAGCFWGIEEKFRVLDGVSKTEVGYSGGHTENPSYTEVCSDATGHAEVVRIVFDPKIITYSELLSVFWSSHDPTQENRQGPDVGSQYRSVIFYTNEAQRKEAEKSLALVSQSGTYTKPLVTKIESMKEFYPAEDYHQQYLLKQGKNVCE
ncbi:MAG: peptide-methionine (S)-S-oxide reductase MsrA [Candidatus Paceibacterota bacterium]